MTNLELIDVVDKMNDWFINVGDTVNPKLINIKVEVLSKLHALRILEQKLQELATLKSTSEWLDIFGISAGCIIDPDGWDRSNFEASWNERITEEEFKKRYSRSTVYLVTGVDRTMHDQLVSKTKI